MEGGGDEEKEESKERGGRGIRGNRRGREKEGRRGKEAPQAGRWGRRKHRQGKAWGRRKHRQGMGGGEKESGQGGPPHSQPPAASRDKFRPLQFSRKWKAFPFGAKMIARSWLRLYPGALGRGSGALQRGSGGPGGGGEGVGLGGGGERVGLGSGALGQRRPIHAPAMKPMPSSSSTEPSSRGASEQSMPLWLGGQGAQGARRNAR